MATWPSGNKPSATTTDADADSISGARVDLNKTVANQSEIIDMFNIPASPTDDYILVYNSAQNRFDVEENTAGFDGNLNGTDLTDSAGQLDIVNSRINIKPNTSDDRKISMGDETFLAPNYLLTSATISGAEERWAFLFLDEHSAGSFPKSIGGGNFTNPTIAGRVQGGTPGSEVAVKSGARLLSFQAFAGLDSDGAGTSYSLPSSANFRIMGETTEAQRTNARGTKLRFDTIKTGTNTSYQTMDMNGEEVRITPGGDGFINCGGDLTIRANFGSNTVKVKKQEFDRLAYNTSSGTGFTPDGDNGEWIDFTAGTSGGLQIQYPPQDMAIGQRISMKVTNTHSGDIAVTFGADYVGLDTSYTINANKTSLFVIENWNNTYVGYVQVSNQS
mgnify:CR=1 FL=1